MFSTLPIVLPIFALILAGFVCRKRQLLGETAAAELNKFVVNLALPALLFDVLARTRISELYQPRFLLVYGLSSLVVFGGALLLRVLQSQHIVDASIEGLGASYSNTGFLGLPLCALTLGRQSLAPAIIATILTVCVTFAIGLVFVELGLQEERHPGLVFWNVSKKLLLNPMIVAPIVGALFSLFGLTVPDSAQQFLKLLGGAATPCALVSIGLFLAASQSPSPTKEQKIPASKRTALFLVGLKLVGQPILAWLLTRWLPMPPVWSNTAVLMSALPTGTGPYMLAELYQRGGLTTSRVILFSTIASVGTVSALLSWMRLG